MLNFEIISTSPKETISIARKLGGLLGKGEILALVGELGSGKTTFIKGLGLAVGAKDSLDINSPTFVLIKEYAFRIPLYHIDAYRIKNPLEMEMAGFDEYLGLDRGIVAVEWADRLMSILPENYLKIEFEHISRIKRRLRFSASKNSRYQIILKKLYKHLNTNAINVL